SDGEPETFLEAFCACGNSLRALGEAADIPIWTERHERAGQLVRAAGGIYKPSGAGGGDVGIAVIPNRDAAGRNGVESALSSAGSTVLPLRYGARGLAVEPAYRTKGFNGSFTHSKLLQADRGPARACHARARSALQRRLPGAAHRQAHPRRPRRRQDDRE